MDVVAGVVSQSQDLFQLRQLYLVCTAIYQRNVRPILPVNFAREMHRSEVRGLI
jgi:hypothetical protein